MMMAGLIAVAAPFGAVRILLLAVLGFAAGLLGAIAGIGGGLLVIPFLTVYFGVPIHQAVGTSLMAVIATSTATSSVYVERHVTDIRLGMTLELGTTVGAVIAAIAAVFIPRKILAILFVCLLVYTGVSLIKRAWFGRKQKADPVIPSYTAHNYPAGLGVSVLAGGISGLLGVGGGLIKVPAMYLFMGVPLRVAAATSNFMIGVTASASAFIYWGRGEVRLDLAAPIIVGVFLGSVFGARLAPKLRSSFVLGLLIFITLFMAVQMILKIANGKL
jgi:uncharacterized membrane protein YfcA